MSEGDQKLAAVNALALRVQESLRDGRIEEAAERVQRLQWLAPNNPNVDLFNGIIKFKQRRYADAIVGLERARSKLPTNPSIHFWLGNALRHAGRLDDAIAMYRSALQRMHSTDVNANLESTETLRRFELSGREALAAHRKTPTAELLQTAVDRARDLAVSGIVAPTEEHVPVATKSALISFVTCTITPAKLERLRTSLTAAMGASPWELVAVTDAKSLCEGYSRGFDRARGEFIVFCHDDIEVLCDRFYDRLMSAFDGADLIGVAGVDKLSGPALAWAGSPHLHGAVTHLQDAAFYPSQFSSAGPRIDRAQALDGLFMATRRDVVELIGFDAVTFDGFDFYDVDFSYRTHLAGLRVRIQTNLHLVHASRGNFGPRYAFYSERFRQKFPEFADVRPIERAYVHEARVATLDDARRFHAWIGYWLAVAGNV